MKSAKTLYLLYCCKYLREENKLIDRFLYATPKLKALDVICNQLGKMF